MSERGQCKSCNAHVLWVVTESGARMPLNAEPERRYVLEAGSDPMVAKQRNTYVSHFATCPHAGRWRNGG